MTCNKGEAEIPKGGGGDTPRKSIPLEGEFPRDIAPPPILRRDGFPGTPVYRQVVKQEGAIVIEIRMTVITVYENG